MRYRKVRSGKNFNIFDGNASQGKGSVACCGTVYVIYVVQINLSRRAITQSANPSQSQAYIIYGNSKS
jgi:hypothetical protein